MTQHQQTKQSTEDIRSQARELANRARQAGVPQDQLREDISEGYQGSTSSGTKEASTTSGR